MKRAIESTWTEVDGLPVFYRRVSAGAAGGTRRPLLLVHGITCCTETMVPFLRVLAEREDAPEVLVPDLPAHGRSAKPARLLAIEDYAGWLQRFLDQREVAQADLFGHSMGGQIALEMAARRAGRFGSAIALGPTLGRRAAGTVRIGAGLGVDSLLEPPSYTLLLTRVFWRMGPIRYFRTVLAMQNHDALALAHEIGAPTLVLQGSRDAIIPKRAGKVLAAALPRGELRIIPGAAHAAQYSHPQETAEAVLGFLRREG